MGRVSNAKERLLDTGSQLMHERGYTAVGVSELCSAAGIKKGSFYHFFPSKLELALEIIDRFAAASSDLFKTLEQPGKPPLQRLADYADGVHQFHLQSRQACGKVLGCPLGNLALEMSNQEPALRQRLRKIFEGNADSFAQLLTEAVERGDIPPLDVRRAATSIIALIEGSILLAKTHNDSDVLEGLAQGIFRLIDADLPGGATASDEVAPS